jgi:hypothetical protein
LLATPELAEPLNSAIGAEYRTNRGAYDGKARASAANGKARVDDFDVVATAKRYEEVPAAAAGDVDDTLESQLTLTHAKPVARVIDQDPDDLLA